MSNERPADLNELLDALRRGDDAPPPDPAFVQRLEGSLLAKHAAARSSDRDRPRRAPVATSHQPLLPRPRRATPGRFGNLAAACLLLLVLAGGLAYGRLDRPASIEPTTIVAVSNSTSPVSATPTTPIIGERTSCGSPKPYGSAHLGQTYVQPDLFSANALSIERMQLQHWSLGIGFSQAFSAEQFWGARGLVVDTVTSGFYTATFDGPVLVTSWGGFGGGRAYTQLPYRGITIDLGPGESVLFGIGTAHTVENRATSRGLEFDRVLLYSGDAPALAMPYVDTPRRPAEWIPSGAPAMGAGIIGTADGTGVISNADALTDWRNTAIILEHVTAWFPETLDVLVPPCEPGTDVAQVRNVDEMRDESGGYSGYLVWIIRGGPGLGP